MFILKALTAKSAKKTLPQLGSKGFHLGILVFKKILNQNLNSWIWDFLCYFWLGFEVAKYDFLLRAVSLSKWL